MMERFPSPSDQKKETPPQESGELSASQLADAIKASREERGNVEVGEIDSEQLRDALSQALKNPVTL